MRKVENRRCNNCLVAWDIHVRPYGYSYWERNSITEIKPSVWPVDDDLKLKIITNDTDILWEYEVRKLFRRRLGSTNRFYIQHHVASDVNFSSRICYGEWIRLLSNRNHLSLNLKDMAATTFWWQWFLFLPSKRNAHHLQYHCYWAISSRNSMDMTCTCHVCRSCI